MMAFISAVAERSVVGLAGILFLAQLVAHAIGYRFGKRDVARHGNAETAGIIVGGMLGLLAFVLALTLSYANTRFSERRAGTVQEANAIGTAWLRAKAIGIPRGEEIARLVEAYARTRTNFVTAGREAATIDALNVRTNTLQSEIWGHVSAIVREKPDPISNALMAALNDMFDASTSERFAFDTRLPPQLLWLLLGMTLLSMGCLGYQLGLRQKPSRILVALLTLMWTAVIISILDLASSRLGAIRTNANVYEWTIQGFKGGITIPPPPR